MSYGYQDYESRHRLSTSLTFILKYGFYPLALIPLLLWIVGAIFQINVNWPVLLSFLSLVIISILSIGDIKSVEVDNDFLYISNYIKTGKIPLAAIVEVGHYRFFRLHHITVIFRNKTEFGNQIVFIPYWDRSQLFGTHRVVTELNQLTKREMK